jgi:hypothetical protein
VNAMLGEENWFWIRFAFVALGFVGLGLVGEFG